MEIWKDIKDYEGLYQISNKGRVYSYRTNKFLSICYTSKGYQIVGFKINGKQVMKQIHRLVAESFIENPENKPCVNHKDGNKENNCVDNLEWCTYSENNKHAYKTKLRKSHVGY